MKLLRFLVLAVACVAVGCGDDGRTGSTDASTDRDIGSMDGGGGEAGTTPSDGGGSGDDGGAGGAAANCPDGECNLLTNEGCGGGDACRFLQPAEGGSPAPMCASAGTGTAGDECESDADCQEKHLCARGECRHFCCDREGCPTGQMCTAVLEDPSTGEATSVGFCSVPDSCDPIMQTGCEDEAEGCYIIGEAQMCTTPREGAEEKTEGASCEYANDCPIGMACVGSMEGDVCRSICDAEAAEPDCPEGAECRAFEARSDSVGVCIPPDGGGEDG